MIRHLCRLLGLSRLMGLGPRPAAPLVYFPPFALRR